MSRSERQKALDVLYEAGNKMRRKVMGDEYVDEQLNKDDSDFARSMQELAVQLAWGAIWTRPGLELKQRSLINIGLLALQGKNVELAKHVEGAIKNGASEVEIRETVLHTAVYCGMPTGMAACRVVDEALKGAAGTSQRAKL